MTDTNQGPNGQDIARPENEEAASLPDQSTLPAEATDSTEKTLELPQVQAVEAAPVDPATAPTQKIEAVPQPEPASEDPTVESPVVPVAESPQPTAVMPTVEPVAESLQTTEPATDLVPPPANEEASPDDTSDFTMSDVTLSDVEPGGPSAWLQSLKTKLGRTRDADSPPKQRRLKPWHWTVIAVGSLLLLFAVFVTVDASVYYGKVHHGINVDGQDLSRMTDDDATEALSALADKAAAEPITLSSDDRSWTILPSDLDAKIDVAAAVSEALAYTRENNAVVDLGKKIALYFKSKEVALKGTLDNDKMDILLGTIAGTLDKPAVNATLRVVDGTIEVVDGAGGLVVDKVALRTSLTDLLFSFHGTELKIPMVETSPDLSAMDVEDALAEATVMISADLDLTYEGKTLATITPEELVTYLDVHQDTAAGETKTVPVLSAEKMATLFDAIEPQVGTKPVDATFTMDLEGEEPYPLVIVEGENGEGLDREATAAALTQAAMSASRRAAEVALMTIEPERTTADIEAMGITDLLGDYKTSPYVGTKNRQQNVRLATSLCSGVFLAPGEEFNTDERLGLRNKDNGWATAPGIVGPGQLEDVYGGGICQVSTTLWNAVLLSGLEITERHNHSIYINHYPDGRDATVTAGGKNMRFRNDTNHYIFIYGWSTGINTHFWIWGVDDGRQVQPIKFSGFSYGTHYTTETYINTSLAVGATDEVFSGQTARRCSVERTIVYADGTTKTDTFSSYYPMMPKVIETNPAPTTTSPPSTDAATSTTAPPAT